MEKRASRDAAQKQQNEKRVSKAGLQNELNFAIIDKTELERLRSSMFCLKHFICVFMTDKRNLSGFVGFGPSYEAWSPVLGSRSWPTSRSFQSIK